MNKPMGIDPTQAHEKVRTGQATLVCADDDERTCRDIMLDGGVTLSQFEAAAERTGKDSEVIFFCASPGEATSARMADEYRRRGFSGSRYLLGGVDGWKKSGFPLAVETPPENPAH